MLRAIYFCGSALLLEKVNDIDKLYCYDTKEEAIEASLKYKHNSKFDIHFCDTKPHIFLGCYAYHYLMLNEGEDLHLNDFNIFKKKIKNEYVELLKKYANRLKASDKKWYHILTACYLYANGEYKLTDEQLNTIQEVHDNGASQSIINYCKEQLELLN